MYRKAYNDLLKWKESGSRKPMILLGARQVGKTWLMKEFGENEYKNVAYINCDSEPIAKELFKDDYDINRMLLGFQAISHESIKPAETLIILDEIQEAERGLHSLKYFHENAPEYHIIAAGSLLGVALTQNYSFPVGKVDTLHLYPMDFEEFLYALEQGNLCEIINSNDTKLIDTFSRRLVALLFQYYYVGGMPEVVKVYAGNSDLREVRRVQTTIIEAYRNDISKHTSKTESVRIGQVISSLPSQLAKENGRFIYGVAKPGGRASEFEIAIQWLIDAGLIYKVSRVSKIAMPLKFYEDIKDFKLFFLDTGLLGCMSDVPGTIILNPENQLTEFKGMLTEQYVAQQLVSAGIKLYYWKSDKTPAEIDFIVQTPQEVIPIEVKASANVRGKSISRFLDQNPTSKGLRFSLLGYIVQDNLTNVPLYELPFFAERALL